MTLTELRYIVAVARERHFGHAAAACFVSQPTLSVAIKKLEDELGVLIFERHQHEVMVTPVGERIVSQAEAVLEQAALLRSVAESGRDQTSGILRLGVIYTVGPYLLPRLIPVLHERAPDLTLVIDEDFTENLAVKLRRGDLDMALVSTPFQEPATRVEILYDEPFVVALPRGHKLASRKQIRAEDLEDDTLLLLRAGNCFRDQVIEVCPACRGGALSRNPIQKTLEGSSIETIRQMVAAGSGTTVLPCSAATGEAGMDSLLEYRQFAKPVPKREIVLAYRNTFPREKLTALLRDAVQSAAPPGVKLRRPT